MKIAIIIFTILATLICVCACQLAPATAPTDPTQTTTMPTEPIESTASPVTPTEVPTEPITDPRIAEFQALLDYTQKESFMNTALLSEYETPENVNLFYLFYNGFHNEPQEPTDQELELLDGKLGQYWRDADLIRLPVDEMNAVLTELFGITLNQTNGIGLDNLVYLPETDCYYHATHGMYAAEIDVKVVQDADGNVAVEYINNGFYKVTLKPTGDGCYHILSNTKSRILYG